MHGSLEPRSRGSRRDGSLPRTPASRIALWAVLSISVPGFAGTPGAAGASAGPLEISGMTLVIRDDRLVVDRVGAGSPAAAAGLLPGDTILVVDDRSLIDLDAISPATALALLETPGAGEVRLIVGRGAGTLGLHLSLRSRDAAGDPRAPRISEMRTGDPAPEFTARDFRGRDLSLRKLRGKPVLIDFWASWCAPCRDQAIPLSRIAGEYGERLTVIGISLDGDPKAFEAFVYNHHLPGSQVMDGGWSGPISRLYRVTAIPYSILVDRTGRIAASGSSLQEVEETLARIAKKESP
jgi:thiol-disulfide isomerase/thioredoxin